MVLWTAIAILAGAVGFLLLRGDPGPLAEFSNDRIAAIVFYLALGLVLVSGLAYAYRRRAGKALRDIAIWTLLMLGLVAGYGFRHDLQRFANQTIAVMVPGYVAEQISTDGTITATLRQRNDRHFVAKTKVNGVSITMLVDTGASLVTLSAADAAAAGLEISPDDYIVRVSTANGQALAAPVRLRSISVGSIAFSGVRALVAQPGALSSSLLGNSFLEALVSYRVEGDRMILTCQR